MMHRRSMMACGAIAALPRVAIGQPAGLAHVYFIPTVLFDVADRDAIAAIKVDSGSGV